MNGEAIKATGPWDVEFAESVCIAQRAFGDVQLIFRMIPLSYRTEVVIAVHPSSRFGRRPGPADATIQIDPASPAKDTRYVRATTADGAWRMLLFYLSREDMAQLVKHQRMAFQAGGERIAVAPTGMAALKKTIDRCFDGLMTAWNIDTSSLATIATEATPATDMGTWITDSDYPALALRQNIEGITVIRMGVDTTGRIAECGIVVTSGSELLDKATCDRVVERGRYNPALDKDGKPVPYWSTQRVRWEIGGGTAR